jgi:hypothetical protein
MEGLPKKLTKTSLWIFTLWTELHKYQSPSAFVALQPIHSSKSLQEYI